MYTKKKALARQPVSIMLLLPSTLILLASLFLPATAQDGETPQIDGAQNSKVAITGAIIGCILVVLALIAVAVYCIERCLRRRVKPASFTPLPTQSEEEPYRYLSLPPAARPTKSYRHGPYYPGATSPPTSPNARTSYGGGSPLRSPGANSVRFDVYGHGPYYPGSMTQASPPTSPNARVSSPRAPPRSSLIVEPFRTDPRSAIHSSDSTSSLNRSVTPSSSSLSDQQTRGSTPRTLSRTTSTILHS
ncbi:hypothetical protein C8R44DRAFT_974566 [Mycena epipterygia]|nr:hypothetical protein C8R44DRAFT_974566 [Mycena epipterygia]